jgi:acyl carrier protein
MLRRDQISRVAESLGLLDERGDLLTLDSLMVMDFLVAIENALGVQIPVADLQEEAFRSLDSVTVLIEKLSPTAP